MAATFSAAMIVNFGKECIELGSDLAEVQNVVDVTFTTMSGKVNEWAKNAAASYGLSETMAKKYVGTFGSMAEAFGFTEQQSYDMSTALAGLSGDVASFYNITQDEAYTKLKSVFSGETETLKDLGIVMTQSALDAYALANGYGKTTSAMTEAEKVSLRFAFVQSQLQNATGDFARTQNSWANQTRILQLRFDSLKATIGQGLINVFTPVIKVVNSLIDRLTTVSEKFKALTEQIFGNAGDTTSGVSSAISGSASSTEELTNEANNSSAALDSVADSAEKAKKSVAGFDKLNILSQESKTETNSSTPTSSTKIPSGSNSLTSAMSKAVNDFSNAWNTKGQKVINSIKKAFGQVKDAVTSIGKSWINVWNNGSGEKFINNIKNYLSTIFDIIGDIAGAFTNAWNEAGRGDKLVQSYIDKWNSFIELLNVIGDTFREVWNDGTGERIWGNILDIITNCNNFTATLREKIKDAWLEGGNGERIWSAILGIVEDITGFVDDITSANLDWIEDLDLTPVTTAVADLSEGFRELLEACGDKLKGAYKNILLPLAKWTIEKAVPTLVEALAGALEILSKIIDKIDVKVIAAIAGGIAAVVAAVKGYNTFVKGVDKIKTAISDFQKVLETNATAIVIGAVIGAITGLVAAIQSTNEQRLSDLGFTEATEKMETAVDNIETYTDEINTLCDDVNSSLGDLSTNMGVVDDYKARLDELLSKVNLSEEEQAELVTIGDYFSDKYPDFKTAWDNYVKVDDEGKVKLVGNIDEIKTNLDTLIAKYKQTAASASLSELMQQNQESYIQSQSAVTNAAVEYEKAQEELEKFKKEWDLTDAHLKSLNNSPGFYTWQNKNSTKNATAGDLKKQYKELKDAVDEASSKYDEACESSAQLALNNDDLARMQAVVNGNYSDASAVLMAYNANLITSTDIENSKWKSLDNLKSKAKEVATESGSNIVFGMNNGVDKYKEQVKEKGLETANLYLDGLNGKDGLDINSPSKKTYQSAVYAVQGLINGFNETSGKISSPVKKIVEKVKTALDPIKNVFSSVFDAIKGVIRTPLNKLMEMLEDFINGIVSAINKVAEGADWAVNTIGNIFGQDWHIGPIDKVELPRFAKGGIVKAPTLAVVGDNAGANTGNPEVIAPLNKLQSMINTSNGSDPATLRQILDYLKRIYEMFVVFKNSGGNSYEFVAKINGSEIFDEIVKQNELYKKRNGGKSAFT